MVFIVRAWFEAPLWGNLNSLPNSEASNAYFKISERNFFFSKPFAFIFLQKKTLKGRSILNRNGRIKISQTKKG